MLKQWTPTHDDLSPMRMLEEFFMTTGFYDLLPLALVMAETLEYNPTEIAHNFHQIVRFFQGDTR